MKHPMQCAKCFRVCRLSDSGKTWVCTICKHREKANGGQAVSDTPMTDEAYFKNSATMYDLAGEMKQIERELNVANEKIEVLLIADCERLRIEEELNAANDRIKSLIEERDKANRLADWKWNLRGEFESLLGTDKIEEGIEAVKELKRRIKRLEEAGDMMALHAQLGGIPLDHIGWVNAWREAKEAKP